MKQIVIRCLSVYFCIFASVDAHKRKKRIIGGSNLPDHKLYNTQFVVSLQNAHTCASDQLDHKLLDCKSYHYCGGSLITEDFVLTACHCLAYEDWYAPDLRPPFRKNLTLGDIPPYLDDRVHNKPREQGDPLVHRRNIRVEHTLHTSMTIFAGHTSLRRTPQRRHSAKFFVHHLCAVREINENPELWADEYSELDIGLVKTCFPFHLNNDVQLAPLKPRNEMVEHLHKMVKMSATCLFVGWGYSLDWYTEEITEGFRVIRPDILQHMFRYIQCNKDCTLDRHACIICSYHHGPKLAATRHGDSGSPVICDGLVTAVHARSMTFTTGWIERNYTIAKHPVVECVKDFIREGHLSYLRSLTHLPFHYVNGKPLEGQ